MILILGILDQLIYRIAWDPFRCPSLLIETKNILSKSSTLTVYMGLQRKLMCQKFGQLTHRQILAHHYKQSQVQSSLW